MMGDIYVLDKNLELIGIVDTYKSCIWANRYNEIGDCELYIPASKDIMLKLQKNYYLTRLNDDMICQIKKIELDTSGEDGDYLIVTGVDVKALLAQRIIWGTMNCDGNVEDFIRNIIDKNILNPENEKRKFKKANGEQLLYLGEKANFDEVSTEQTSYRNIEEKINEYCQTYKWGHKIVLDGEKLYFQLYKGTDRSDKVVFSDDYENLDTTTYIEDDTNLGNVALIAGEGQGSARSKNIIGDSIGTDRYEIFVDAKDISKTITWEELIEMYPTSQGQIISEGDGFVYKMNYINIQIVTDEQLEKLKEAYPDGIEITRYNHPYYQIYNVVIADLETDEPENSDNVTLRDIVYSVYLLSRGQEKLSEYGNITSFDGVIEPNTTFEYKKDYFLGDIVTIENNYGIVVNARIIEIIETDDDNGYSVEPKFEYIEEG